MTLMGEERSCEGWHLAQINIGRLVASKCDPRVQTFFDALDIGYSHDPLLAVNMSVWDNAEALLDFVNRSALSLGEYCLGNA